nr:unnamed protein product [Digitaria exilis]
MGWPGQPLDRSAELSARVVLIDNLLHHVHVQANRCARARWSRGPPHRPPLQVAKLLSKCVWPGEMRCAGVLLAVLLSLSALAASTAEAHKERLVGDNVVLLTGRKWLRGRKIMAALGHGGGGAAKKDEVVEGKEAKSTGANTVHVHGEEEKTVEVTVVGLGGEGAELASQEADPPADAVHDSGRRSKGSAAHTMLAEPRQGVTAAVAPEILGMDYSNYNLGAHHHRPINNDAPLDDLAKKP